MSWNPDQYLKFAAPRLQPAIDLLARVPLAHPQTVYDLGCGAGNVTQLLAARWPRATITGVDDSADMLAKAAVAAPGVNWVQQSLASWRAPAPADLIYSNAALHWLPDHQRLFPALVEAARSGRRAGGADAAQLRCAVAHADRRDGSQRPLAGAAGAAAGAQPGGRAGVLLRRAERARRAARHLGDRIPAGALGRRPGEGVDQGHLAQAVPRRAR